MGAGRVAGAAAGQHDPVHTARLFGVAEALRETIGAPLPPHVSDFYAPYIAAARAHLDPATFDAAWQAGRGLTLEQALAAAGAIAGTRVRRPVDQVEHERYVAQARPVRDEREFAAEWQTGRGLTIEQAGFAADAEAETVDLLAV